MTTVSRVFPSRLHECCHRKFCVVFCRRFSLPGTGKSDIHVPATLQTNMLGKPNASYRLPYTTRSKDGGREVHTIAVGSIIDCNASDAQDGVQ